ncbi:MAG: hypothetical protein H7338_09455 [Candidatus Sericytochromatia bacterium]|nr:hypothetical protein [Candidatus Sericytochromatia bacterium]
MTRLASTAGTLITVALLFGGLGGIVNAAPAAKPAANPAAPKWHTAPFASDTSSLKG